VVRVLHQMAADCVSMDHFWWPSRRDKTARWRAWHIFRTAHANTLVRR